MILSLRLSALTVTGTIPWPLIMGLVPSSDMWLQLSPKYSRSRLKGPIHHRKWGEKDCALISQTRARKDSMVRWLRRINYRVDHKRFMEAPGLILDIYGTNYIFFFTSSSPVTLPFRVQLSSSLYVAVNCIPSKYVHVKVNEQPTVSFVQ